MTQYLVTPALPYANGPIHLGHLLEHIQVNIFVRALKMAEKDVLYVCGADSHGTPIEINAQKAGLSPLDFVQKWQKAHEATFKRYLIEFDGGYGTTHTKENQQHAYRIFEALSQKGHIEKKEIEQLYDPLSNRFLPDRMVVGTCPKCQAPDQYGDNCEKCGSTYSPTELKNPKSTLSGATPILKSSTHYFFKLSNYIDELQQWIRSGALTKEVQNSLQKWLSEGLKDWDISRDGPYFGFLIPGESDKYFYVWMDAPIGYLSLAEKAASLKGKTFEDYLLNPETKMIHFIGKDIVYFHTLFWPALLMGAKYILPNKIQTHGMLTVNGEKMSKSRGTFILADHFADHLPVEALRYYLASKLSNKIDDIDLNLEDLANKVNADLVNNLVNLLSRTIPLLHRNFNGFLSHKEPDHHPLIQSFLELPSCVFKNYQEVDTALVTKQITEKASLANAYLQECAPWANLKNDPKKAQQQLSTALWCGKVCMALLKPILPHLAHQVEKLLNLEPLDFQNALADLSIETPVKPYTHLWNRITKEQLEALVTPKNDTPPAISYIEIEDFAKVELLAAHVLQAKAVEGSEKLIALELDVGAKGKRQVLTGLRPHIKPEDLLNQTLMLVYNLKPRKMKLGLSEGMVLAVGEPAQPIFLPKGTKPGERVS